MLSVNITNKFIEKYIDVKEDQFESLFLYVVCYIMLQISIITFLSNFVFQTQKMMQEFLEKKFKEEKEMR